MANSPSDKDALKRDPHSPGQYRSGVDEPGEPTKKNPGHANPAHNTPGHEREDSKGRARTHPEEPQTQSYPGIKGPKARALEQSKPPTEPASEKHPETISARERRTPQQGK